MQVTIKIDVDPEFVDSDHESGLTNEGYERLVDALTSSVAESIGDVTRG